MPRRECLSFSQSLNIGITVAVEYTLIEGDFAVKETVHSSALQRPTCE